MPEQMTKQDAIEYLLYMKHDVQAKSPMDIALDTAIEALKQPTIEPEVRHGRMIEGRYPNENKCSECGKMFRDDIQFIIQDDDGAFHNPVRCPECGCYWDGGTDNDKT